MRRTLAALLVLALGGCGGAPRRTGKPLIVTTVSPITDLARQVAGDAADVEGIVPEGTDSHTFEPTPSSARLLAQADLVVVNGLHLEDPTIRLAEANKKKDTPVVALGDRAIDADRYIYDFSFPRSEGKPNPHLWMDVAAAIRYVELIRDAIVARDAPNAATYRSNADAYLAVLRKLDAGVQAAVNTVPADKRVLLTYHDSYAYFARHYRMRVIGAIQPSDFAEPSAKEVARLITQVRRERVPAIFGSEVFPSPILAQIAKESGARYEASLRDDDLPGEPGDAEHSYVGMMIYNVRTIVRLLGGDPSALDGISPKSRYD